MHYSFIMASVLAAVVGADRFLAEIKTTANLQHPHILPLFDSGEADSFLFYVMPYVEGESIRELITKATGLDGAAGYVVFGESTAPRRACLGSPTSAPACRTRRVSQNR